MLGLGRIIAINDPILLEHVLKTNFENYEKGYIINSTMSQVLGNGMEATPCMQIEEKQQRHSSIDKNSLLIPLAVV